jgi:hypothetical protein
MADTVITKGTPVTSTGDMDGYPRYLSKGPRPRPIEISSGTSGRVVSILGTQPESYTVDFIVDGIKVRRNCIYDQIRVL